MPVPFEPPSVAFPTGAPGRWVRLPPIEDTHDRESRGLILDAADRVRPGRAIALGAGHCREIPLVELCRRFEHLTLNDHDGPALEAALRDSGLDAGKDRLLVADLTGVTAAFVREVGRSLDATADPGAAIDQVAQVADSTRPEAFRTDGSYDLVVASCVLGQLHVAACNRAIQLFVAKFPARVDEFRHSDRWTRAMYGLARRMESTFIDSLHGLAEPDGRIVLSESVRFCFLYPSGDGGWMTNGFYRMTRTTRLTDELDDRFVVERRGRWSWIVDPPAAPGQVGRLFDVEGLLLRKKCGVEC
ncbi:MAG TPA: hypothetical protein VG406_27870 [Isosphaeraceae bacterium]|jgi:hypothetical protein|nr:hypothetical protein [Isosphaeraceae bacterium]